MLNLGTFSIYPWINNAYIWWCVVDVQNWYSIISSYICCTCAVQLELPQYIYHYLPKLSLFTEADEIFLLRHLIPSPTKVNLKAVRTLGSRISCVPVNAFQIRVFSWSHKNRHFCVMIVLINSVSMSCNSCFFCFKISF